MITTNARKVHHAPNSLKEAVRRVGGLRRQDAHLLWTILCRPRTRAGTTPGGVTVPCCRPNVAAVERRLTHGVASALVWAREPAGVSGDVESIPSADGIIKESAAVGLVFNPPEALSVGLSVSLDGVSVGLSVGFLVGFGMVAALALVMVTVTGAPGLAVKVFVSL
jgi:hypothetical protein